MAFCLKLHNHAVTALRFPPNAFRKYLQTSEVRFGGVFKRVESRSHHHPNDKIALQERRQLELQEAEIAEEIEKAGDDDEDF